MPTKNDMNLDEMKKYIDDKKLAQKIAYAKFYKINREKIILKNQEYRNIKKETSEPKLLSPEQIKKKDYNAKYQLKLKTIKK